MNIQLPSICMLIISTVLVGSANSAFAQSFNEEVLREEIITVWNNYISVFSEGRADVIADRIYADQSHYVENDGPVFVPTRAENEDEFQTLFTGLEAQDYDKSETQYMNICVLNPTGAILSAVYTRYRTDGSILLESGGTYMFAKFAEGWRILAVIGHSPEKVIQCAG